LARGFFLPAILSIAALVLTQEVLALLGDPQKSSDSIYNFPFYPTPKDRLVYRFDTGYGGWQFDFSFDRHNRVTKLTPRGIE
jgi:hypothetical protein